MLAVAAVALLAYFVHAHRRPGFPLVRAAAIFYAMSVIHWWAAFANWPYRVQWEGSHALLALITFVGFVALTASVLVDSFPLVEKRAPLPRDANAEKRKAR